MEREINNAEMIQEFSQRESLRSLKNRWCDTNSNDPVRRTTSTCEVQEMSYDCRDLWKHVSRHFLSVAQDKSHYVHVLRCSFYRVASPLNKYLLNECRNAVVHRRQGKSSCFKQKQINQRETKCRWNSRICKGKKEILHQVEQRKLLVDLNRSGCCETASRQNILPVLLISICFWNPRIWGDELKHRNSDAASEEVRLSIR